MVEPCFKKRTLTLPSAAFTMYRSYSIRVPRILFSQSLEISLSLCAQ